ncbi:MAG TPA: hypothetical protein VGM46_13790 [Mesorhizobium sp.]
MLRFQEEAQLFGATKLAATARAQQIAAMQLVCGIDLSAALRAGPDAQGQIICRVERVIERERLKGMRRHWSYDLNRHIALKQVLDQLRKLQPEGDASPAKKKLRRTVSTNGNGARRRRQNRKILGKDG